MQSTVHSPGKWDHTDFQLCGHHSDEVTIYCDDEEIATIHPIGSVRERNGNAKLVCASPRLLDACKDARDELQRFQLEDAECLTVERTAWLVDKLTKAINEAE